MDPIHMVVLSMHANQVPNIGQVLFTEDNVVTGKHPESLYISEEHWEAMGEPTTVTLTVEVGDKLDLDES